MNDNARIIEIKFKLKLIDKIKELLETKHLYQNVGIDLTEYKNEIGKIQNKRGDYLLQGGSHSPKLLSQKDADLALHHEIFRDLNELVNKSWVFKTETPSEEANQQTKQTGWIQLPTIKIRGITESCV